MMAAPALPEMRAPLDFAGSYSGADYAILTRGLHAEEMEDRWDAVFEGPWLYLCRSWTGFCIYGLRFAVSDAGEAVVVESWVSRDASQYGGDGDSVEYERAVARFIVEGLMLHRYMELPDPPGEPLSGLDRAAYEDTMVGRIASQATFSWFLEQERAKRGVIRRVSDGPVLRNVWRSVVGRFLHRR